MKFRMLFLFLLVLSCTQEATISSSALDYLPQNAAAIIKINDLSAFKSELKNNGFFSRAETAKLSSAIREKIDVLNFLDPDTKCTIGFYELGKTNFEFLFVTDNNPELINFNGLKNTTKETFTYENREILKYSIADKPLFIFKMEGKIIASSSQLLLENFIRTGKNQETPYELSKLYNTADATKSASLLLNLKKGANLLAANLKDTSPLRLDNFSDYISFDFSSDPGKTLLSGISVSSDSITNFVNLFKGTLAGNDGLGSIAPGNTDAILSYHFSDYRTFALNQEKHLDRVQGTDTLFNTIEEVGVIFRDKEKAVVLNSYGADNLVENLEQYRVGSSLYQSIEIVTLNNKTFIEKTFDPLVKNFESNFYMVLENTFVFAQKTEILQRIIANVKSGTTFDKTQVYRTAKNALANESSVLFISNKNGIQDFLELDFSPQLFKDFKAIDFDDYVFAAQLVADVDFYHLNVFTAETKKELKTNTLGSLFTVQLDTDLITDPQFVTNHRTNKKEVVVQDKDNFLYLISTEGKVLWKKQLNGKVQGQIHQVDIYKNGRLQLAFCTNNQFLILDRNGEEVKPFTKSFEGGNLNPLAVFDYEKNKEYRFVITQGRKIFMYDRNGNIVKGFTYKEAESPIIAAPEHFQVNKKDYLLFKLENNTLKIRHRAGQDRVNVAAKIDFSDNGLFLYKNKFSLTDNKGVFYQIDTKGKVLTTNFNLNQDHGMFATSKTLVLMNDNILSVKGKKVELELGVYTKPKIFYIYDKIYVAVTDIQNQKIHLYDSQAKPISNFPVYGTSVIDLVDMDGDKNLELVSKDQENSIIVYKIN